mgnify:CR=1 FL=1
MNYKGILFFLGIYSLFVSFFSILNILYSIYFNFISDLNSFVISLIISLIVGFSFCFVGSGHNKNISLSDQIVLIILSFIFIPLLISIPYFLSIYNISFLDSYFETISGFTSTGFTIFENIKHLDQSLIIWRSTSQWVGGIYFLFSIILLTDIFDNSLKKSLTNFISFNTSETFKQSFKILILYIILTLVLFIVLNLINIRSFDAFNLSMTIISSGGFLPVNNIEVIINSNFKEVVFSILMLTSFFSLFLSYNIIFLKNKSLNFFTEDIYLLIYFVFLVSIFFIFFNFNYNFSSIFFSLTSSISNIGISLNDIPNNLSFIFLILVIIGGSFFSTSSGIRFVKIYSLLKFSINELLSHSRPKYVYINKFSFSDNYIEQSDLYKYFLSLLVFIISLFIISSLLTISNINMEESFKLGILTLMNTVNSSMFGLNDFNFLNLNISSKLILIIFMIIGRVELLTILIICKKFLFKN